MLVPSMVPSVDECVCFVLNGCVCVCVVVSGMTCWLGNVPVLPCTVPVIQGQNPFPGAIPVFPGCIPGLVLMLELWRGMTIYFLNILSILEWQFGKGSIMLKNIHFVISIVSH